MKILRTWTADRDLSHQLLQWFPDFLDRILLLATSFLGDYVRDFLSGSCPKLLIWGWLGYLFHEGWGKVGRLYLTAKRWRWGI